MPVSKGRRKKSKSRDRRPSASQTYAALIREFEGEAAEDPLMAEVLASSYSSGAVELDDDLMPDDTSFLKVIDFAGGRTTRGALTLLRAMQTIGMTPDTRQAAMEAAEEVAATGVAEPAWLASIDQIEGGRCWQIGDVYGDDVTVTAEFVRDGKRHGFDALIDLTVLDGAVDEFDLVFDIDGLIAEYREAVADDPLNQLVEVPLRDGLELLRGAMVMPLLEQDDHADHDHDDDWVPPEASAPLVFARCRALGMPDAQPAVRRPPPEERISEILETFMGSAQAKTLTDPDAARVIVLLLTEYGWSMDAERPTRVSPSKLAAFVLDSLPATVVLPARFQAAVPDAVRAWAAWSAAEHDLPPAVIDDLDSELDDILADFPEAYAEAPGGLGEAPIVVTDQGEFITEFEE